MLLEARRVLEADGLLLLTTPNCSSATAVARVLRADRNTNTFSSYQRPDRAESELAPLHIREYTVAEIGELLNAAGFAVEVLFNERIAGFPESNWVEDILKAHRLPVDPRGEPTYCLARKRPDAVITRYPGFLYSE